MKMADQFMQGPIGLLSMFMWVCFAIFVFCVFYERPLDDVLLSYAMSAVFGLSIKFLQDYDITLGIDAEEATWVFALHDSIHHGKGPFYGDDASVLK